MINTAECTIKILQHIGNTISKQKKISTNLSHQYNFPFFTSFRVRTKFQFWLKLRSCPIVHVPSPDSHLLVSSAKVDWHTGIVSLLPVFLSVRQTKAWWSPKQTAHSFQNCKRSFFCIFSLDLLPMGLLTLILE